MNYRPKTKIILSILTMAISAPTYASTLRVNIDEVSHDKGKIYAQIFKGKENYENGKPLASLMTDPKSGPFSLEFGGLQPGDYAVRFYHDENGDGKLNKNLLGIPTEGYGFSSEATASFSAPKYQQMKVEVAEGEDTVITKAKMTY